MEHEHPKTLQTSRLLASVSHLNRHDLEVHCTYSTRNEGMSPNGLYSFARPVAHADEILAWKQTETGWVYHPKDFKTASPSDWDRVVGVFRELYSPEAAYNRVVSLRKHVRYLFLVDDLEKSEELGRKLGEAIEKSLYICRPEAEVVGQLVSEPLFDALLDCIRPRNSLSPPFPMEVRDRACLAVLRASGFRVSEHVSLRLRGVEREQHMILVNGQSVPQVVYRLALDRDAADLKTGARTIYIQDPRAVAALDAWLAVHPFRDDPEAFLWIAGETQGMRQLASENVRRLLTKAVAWASKAVAWVAQHVRGKPKLTPHDLRHTCATEKARLGWNEYQMCQYFGWRIGSKTPRIYVHLSLDDQRTLILRDAQKLAAPATAAPPLAADAIQALVGLVKAAAAHMGHTPGAAPAAA